MDSYTNNYKFKVSFIAYIILILCTQYSCAVVTHTHSYILQNEAQDQSSLLPKCKNGEIS